jgi:hypothetical protein
MCADPLLLSVDKLPADNAHVLKEFCLSLHANNQTLWLLLSAMPWKYVEITRSASDVKGKTAIERAKNVIYCHSCVSMLGH